MNQNFINFQLEDEPWNSTSASVAGAAAADADSRRRSPAWTEEQLMELWQNGATALPVSFPPASVGVGAAERLLTEEDDDLASWLNYHIDVAESSCQGDKLVRGEADAMMTMVGSKAMPMTPAAVQGLTVAGPSERTLRKSSVSDERKRKKAMGAEEEEQDAEYDGSSERRKNPPQCASVRKLHSTEVHNQSERRRRNSINTKMKALQELVPKCNKSDKASTLDEAIEYVKSLQLQVQMMSMGYSAGPLMLPGVHTCLGPGGMGMHMGLGMGMGPGTPTVGAKTFTSNLVYPMHQFGPIPPCPAIAGQPWVPLSPRPFLVPFHSSPVLAADQTRVEAINQQNKSSNAATITNSSAEQIPFIGDPSHGFPTQQLVSQAQFRVPGEVESTKEKSAQKPTMG